MQYVQKKWPLRLTAECPPPTPPNRFEQLTKELPEEIEAWRRALRDCNAQLEEGKKYEQEVEKEIQELNRKNSP